MIFGLLAAVPAYRGMVHSSTGDTLTNLQIGCAMSEAVARQVPRQDRLVLPSAQSHGFHWIGRANATGCDLAHSRNAFVQAAIDMRAHWLLMLDADNWQLDPGPIFRMLVDGWSRGAAAIAAPVARRDGWMNVVLSGEATATRAELADRVQPARRIGTACMAINVPWINEHWKWDHTDPWFQFRPTTHAGKPHSISEDFVFCDGVHAHGGELLVDGRFEPRHDGVRYSDDVGAHPADPRRQDG